MARAGRALILASAGLALLAGAGACRREASPGALRFWAFGREGEVVKELVRDFERENPGLSVDVQQIPWTAAHEKLLTAFVGRTTPDVVQVGNTWIPELTALAALEPLGPWLSRSASAQPADYFPGIWETNVMEGELFGIPWYVDTRLLFYRADLLRQAGVSAPPRTWAEWKSTLGILQTNVRQGGSAILLPTNEWTQPVILGLQAGSPLLRDNARHGAFRAPEFRRAAEFYVSLFTEGYAPSVTNNQVSNVYQEFDAGLLTMWITGPWCVGEFRRRLAPSRQDVWQTAPLPSPDPAATVPGVSLAGGASLAIFRASERKEAAWKLVEFLSSPAVQLKFYELTGDLPARMKAWEDPLLRDDPKAAAFATQLRHVVATPKVPEWESIATRIQEHLESVIKRQSSLDQALERLDADADRILEKRRWLLERRARDAR